MAQPGSWDRRIRYWHRNNVLDIPGRGPGLAVSRYCDQPIYNNTKSADQDLFVYVDQKSLDQDSLHTMNDSPESTGRRWTRNRSTLNLIDLRRTRTHYRVNYACYTGFRHPKVPALTGVAGALAKISIWEPVQEVWTRNCNLSWQNDINMANPSRSMGSLKGFCMTKAKALDNFLGSVKDRDITSDDVKTIKKLRGALEEQFDHMHLKWEVLILADVDPFMRNARKTTMSPKSWLTNIWWQPKLH